MSWPVEVDSNLRGRGPGSRAITPGGRRAQRPTGPLCWLAVVGEIALHDGLASCYWIGFLALTFLPTYLSIPVGLIEVVKVKAGEVDYGRVAVCLMLCCCWDGW
jgi:hypothetical protein